MATSEHLEQQLRELKQEYELLSQKIGRLRHEMVITNDVNLKFQYENQLKAAETEREELDAKIEKIENQLLKILSQKEAQEVGAGREVRIKQGDFAPTSDKLWERYEQIEFIGQGAVAEVYRVRKGTVGAEFALKVLKTVFHHELPVIARFWAEGRITGLLGNEGRHHIVHVSDMRRSADDRFFIEMAYLPGRTLDQVLAEQGRLSPERAVNVLRQIAVALRHAHAHRIIHRDLKPQNMMLSADDHLTLIDFGIAKRQDANTLLSRDGFTGTATYAAPEQFDSETYGPVTERSDMYSLGILAFEMLTGQVPYTGSEMNVAFGHCHKPLPAFPDDLSQPICDWITRCTHKQPTERFENMEAVLQALDALQPARDDISPRNVISLNELNERKQPKEAAARKRRQDPAADLPTFTFETVRTNERGQIIERIPGQAKQQVVTLPGGVTLEMVYISGGTFTIGSPDSETDRMNSEGPQKQVTIAPFFMGKYPVTQAQWQAVMGQNPSHFKGDNRPVDTVSWDDAQAFIKKLSEAVTFGKSGFRLPTEAEWEYACRAGTTTPFAFGPTITPEIVNYDGNYPYGQAPKGAYRQKTTPVGSFPPNGWGLYDMHGNVWEWCQDNWHDNYEGLTAEGTWLSVGDTQRRVLRGGGWLDLGFSCRSASRYRDLPDLRNDFRGFRVAGG